MAALQGAGRCEVPCAIGGDILGTSLEESIWILPSGASLPPSPKGLRRVLGLGMKHSVAAV